MEIFSCQSSYPRICPFPKITYFFVVRASCPSDPLINLPCRFVSPDLYPFGRKPITDHQKRLLCNFPDSVFIQKKPVDQWLCHLIFSCKHNILLVFFYYICLFDRTSRLLTDSKDIFSDTDCTGRYYDYFFSFRVALNSISFFLFSIHILSRYK